MMRSVLGQLVIEQFAGLHAEGITENAKYAKADAIRMPSGIYKPLRCRHGKPSLAQLVEAVGCPDGRRVCGHQLGKSKSHIQHDSKITTASGISNTGYPLAVMVTNGYITVSLWGGERGTN